MTITFGDVDWNSADVQVGTSDFMTLEEGLNVVRIMKNPHQFYVNWVDLPGGGKKKIVSPISSPALLQKLEDDGFRRQTRWMLTVLDRKDERFKLLEVGSQIFSGIQDYVSNPVWGAVTDYDITIKKSVTTKNNKKQTSYSVQPNPKEPMSGKFQKSYQDFLSRMDPARFTKPATPEEVCADMHYNIAKYGTQVVESEPQVAETDIDTETESGEEGGGEFDFDFTFDGDQDQE